MKLFCQIIASALTMVLVVNFCIFSAIQTFAHDENLEVSYNDCRYTENDDDINKMWYVLNDGISCIHLSDDEYTIKYYFEEIPPESSILSNNVTYELIETIKTSFATSMKKWNNVYFYSYNEDGTLIAKNKVINIIEGTELDHNLSISFTQSGHAASIYLVDDAMVPVVDNSIEHFHCSQYTMTINVNYFYVNDNCDIMTVLHNNASTGAHEIGHMLGLMDIDAYDICHAHLGYFHHDEVLMGYGESGNGSTSEITYRDLAGVAITRGFHTDADHRWLCIEQSAGIYKLICSICNGVKYVTNPSEYEYDTHGACNNNHELESGNMMAVASYGDKDYYKCKYCRYVAPFSYIEEQDYSATPAADGIHHICTNNVTGLSYSFLEEHTWVDGECEVCGYEHPHTWEEGRCTGCGYVHPHMLINGVCAGCGFEHDHDFLYMYRNGNYHFIRCDCGYNKLEPHFIRSSQIVDGRYANCLGCGRRLDLWEDSANVQPTATSKFSVNGSYILPNGIVVLVDEDIEAYLNGTLVFYNRDDIPTVE